MTIYLYSWSEDESKTLYETYQEQYRCNPFGDVTIDAGNKLIELMAEQKKKRWETRSLQLI